MARTSSTMMPLGTIAPNFELPDASLKLKYSRDQVKRDKGMLVMFICNHCPYVKHMQTQLGELSQYLDKGVGIVAISSNDIDNYPADAPPLMLDFAQQNGFSFPYLYDESQEVAKAYDAVCTPDFFLFDGELKCVYRGRYDSSTPGNNDPITGDDLLNAIHALINGETISDQQLSSVGCNIKWN